jgi:prepilin-type N-terminal cleavage/methylation domain-containing protein
MSPAIRPLVSTGCVTYDVKRVVEIGLLHTNGDPAEYKRALCATKTCSRKQVAPGFTWVPALRGRFRAFTLVEMLIVMIIMLIALGALIPAVTSLSKSNGRQAATSNLIGAIEQARAEAIKSGQPTYVVFPTTLSSTDPNLVQRYSYHSYAIFEDDPLNPATPKQLSGWKTLPTGVSLRSAISSWSLASFQFTPVGSAQSFPFLKFNANGEVEAPAAPPANVLLGIFEGYVVSNGSEVITGAKDSSNPPNPLASEYISVSRITGRAEPTATPTP